MSQFKVVHPNLWPVICALWIFTAMI